MFIQIEFFNKTETKIKEFGHDLSLLKNKLDKELNYGFFDFDILESGDYEDAEFDKLQRPQKIKNEIVLMIDDSNASYNIYFEEILEVMKRHVDKNRELIRVMRDIDFVEKII